MEGKVEIFKSKNNQTEIQVQFDNDTVWLNRKQLTILFNRDRTVISRHISNIFKEVELQRDMVCAKFAHTTQHGAIKGKEQQSETEYFNLDVIISLGYRVKSQEGTQFRQWATQRLKDYLVKGYAINEKRLLQKQKQIEYLKKEKYKSINKDNIELSKILSSIIITTKNKQKMQNGNSKFTIHNS